MISNASTVSDLPRQTQTRIRSQARLHMDGKLSYCSALKNVKSNGGIFERIYNWCEGQFSTENNRETFFKQELTRIKIEYAKESFNKMKSCMERISKPIGIDDRIVLQQCFSNIDLDDSNFNLRFSLDKKDNINNKLTISLSCRDKDGNLLNDKDDKILDTPFEVDYNKDIYVEYAIYRNKQYGEEIPKELENDEEIQKYLKTEKESQYKGLNFSGGGAKGIFYPGHLEALGGHRLSEVETVSGTSAGAITAAIVAAGVKPHEFTEFVHTMESHFTQSELKSIVHKMMIKTIRARLEEFKANYKNEDTNNPLRANRECLIEKYANSNDNDPEPSLTFKDLKELRDAFPMLGFKTPFFNVTYRGPNGDIAVDLSISSAPNMEIAQAVIASAALPIPFPLNHILGHNYPPVDITDALDNGVKKALRADSATRILVVDGGITRNHPVSLSLRGDGATVRDSIGYQVTGDFEPKSSCLSNSRVDDNGDEYKEDEVKEGDDNITKPFLPNNLNDDEFKESEIKESDNKRSILCFAFEDGKDLHKRPPYLVEHGKSLVGGKEMLGLRRHEIRMLEKYNHHFLKVQGIGTTESKKATRKFMEFTRSAKNDFAEYEVRNRGKMKFTSFTDENAHRRDHILRNYSKQLFMGGVVGRVLNSTYELKGKIKWIDKLYENDISNDHEEFIENYKQLENEIEKERMNELERRRKPFLAQADIKVSF